MKAIGIVSGIGSMLIGARDAGFEITANADWRDYYFHEDEYGRNTFRENFPGAVFKRMKEPMTEAEFEAFSNPDLAMSHCDCGNYSQLSSANKNKNEKMKDANDTPLMVDWVKRFKPRFFVSDNLPKLLISYPMEKWAEELPNYDLFPEWISNYHYGNIQKGRKRFFMIGALKSERFVFRPGEFEHNETVSDRIGDLPEPRAGSNIPNHDPHVIDDECYRALNLGSYRHRATWREAMEYFKSVPHGRVMRYIKEDGTETSRIGFATNHWNGPSHVLTGGNPSVHPIRCLPLTIRERARIQGVPDDFVFYGTKLREGGYWSHDDNLVMIRETGKFMPVEFCRFVSQQIAAHIKGETFACSDERLLPSEPHIDEAKDIYCRNVGYADQEGACGACWLQRSCDLCVIPQPEKPARSKPAAAVRAEKKISVSRRPAAVVVKQVPTKRISF